jgi:hypothetical protein
MKIIFYVRHCYKRRGPDGTGNFMESRVVYKRQGVATFEWLQLIEFFLISGFLPTSQLRVSWPGIAQATLIFLSQYTAKIQKKYNDSHPGMIVPSDNVLCLALFHLRHVLCATTNHSKKLLENSNLFLMGYVTIMKFDLFLSWILSGPYPGWEADTAIPLTRCFLTEFRSH